MHQASDAIRNVNFQMTNTFTGSAPTDGFLVDINDIGHLRLNQQERAAMEFWGIDATLGNSNVNRGEWTYGKAMQENQLAPTDGFRIWNPGYSSSTSYNPDHALDLWCGNSNTTHIRFDHSGLIQTINLRFEQIARLSGFWFDARPYDYQKTAGYRGEYYFNIDSIEIGRYSNSNNTNLGFMRIGRQPAGQLASTGVDATRRLEIYDAADVPQFRITRATDASYVPQVYTDFQTTSLGNLFINPINGVNPGNVGIGISGPTAKLEVNSPTVAGGTQTTLRLDNINTGAAHPRGIDIDIQGTGGGLTQATGINLNMTGTYSSSSAATYITNSTTGAANGHGIWSNVTGANTNNYGLRSYSTNATGTNYAAYLIGSGGVSSLGADCYASNGTTLNYAIRAAATGASGSTNARGVSATASGSITNYGGFLQGSATSTNTAFGAYAEGYGGDVAYGVYAKASGATTNNYGINASSSGGANSIGIKISTSGGSSVNYGVYATVAPAGCTTGSPCYDAAIYAAGSGYTTDDWYKSSDASIKKNISPIDDYWTILNGLNGYRYDFDTTLNSTTNLNLTSRPQIGLISQEVELVLPEVVKSFINPGSTDSNGIVKNDYVVKAVNYDGVIPVLVEAIKDLKEKVDSLMANAASIRTKNNIDNVENKNINREFANEQKITLSNQQGIILKQNDPNPFSESTRISYFIPEDVKDARLIFSSENGLVLKTVQLVESGEGSIEVYASDLSSGLYIYTLMVDGKIIESKKMIKH